MAEVSGRIAATPQAVFAVLADGWTYSNWVVGTSHMRAVQESWPAVGSKLFHASGVWPVVTRDETEVEVCEFDRRLVLVARGRPLGEARVTIDLAADGSETVVTMQEAPIAGPGKWLHNPVLDAGLRRRNVETIDRLKALVERHTEPQG